jgi:uncharacterized protein YcnI
MQIPTDHPVAQLLVEPVPGWTISIRTITLAKPLITDDGQFTQAVSEVIWSGGRTLNVKLTAEKPGIYLSAPVIVTITGQWQLRITIRTDAFDETTVAISVAVH